MSTQLKILILHYTINFSKEFSQLIFQQGILCLQTTFMCMYVCVVLYVYMYIIKIMFLSSPSQN